MENHGDLKESINSLVSEAIFRTQSYKASTIVINNSRVVPDLKISHIMTLEL